MDSSIDSIGSILDGIANASVQRALAGATGPGSAAGSFASQLQAQFDKVKSSQADIDQLWKQAQARAIGDGGGADAVLQALSSEDDRTSGYRGHGSYRSSPSSLGDLSWLM